MSPHLRSRTATLIAYVVCAALLSACGDDDANTQTATDADPTDAATSSDADPTDAATSSDADPTDAATSSDADPTDAVTSTDADPTDTSSDTADVTTGPACAFPSPRQADEANALSADAAKCGQAPYTWLNNPSLGDVVGYGARLPLTAAAINDLATSEGITLPKPAVHDVRVIQYRYVTQAHGVPTEATSLAAFPSDLGPDDPPPPILVILHGTIGFNDACSPSSSLDAQGFGALFASFGYFVVGPDYLGLNGLGTSDTYLHPYLVGEPTAMSSLDAIRAAGRLPAERRGDTCASPRVVVLGGSQGGHAALWLDRLAPYYAPELDIVGIVATVPPADLLAQAERALLTPVEATANTMAVVSTHADWYGTLDRLSEVFIDPLQTTIPTALATSCDPGDALDDFTTLEEVFQPSILAAAAAGTLTDLDPWGCYVTENSLTSTSIPRHPTPKPDTYGILYILGEQDNLVNTPIERASFQTLCDEQSMPLQYLECAGASHTRTTVWAIPEILAFVEARLNNEPLLPADLCQVSAPVRCQGTPLTNPDQPRAASAGADVTYSNPPPAEREKALKECKGGGAAQRATGGTSPSNWRYLTEQLEVPHRATVSPPPSNWQRLGDLLAVPHRATGSPSPSNWQSLIKQLAVPHRATGSPSPSNWQPLIKQLAVPHRATGSPSPSNWQPLIKQLAAPHRATGGTSTSDCKRLNQRLEVPR
jgi:hypothetical protein